MQAWLPEDHLARFVVEIVERLDLRELTTAYRGRGSDAAHPAMMVALLFYGYATGVLSSRKLEQASFDSVAPVIGKAEALIAAAGYFSADNVAACPQHLVTPDIATGRDAHYPPLAERLCAPAPPPDDASAVDRMKHRLRTPEGRHVYATRKCTVEPTFGIIKSVHGFRQFLLRGLRCVQHEWTLVCIGWNLKRLHRLNLAS